MSLLLGLALTLALCAAILAVSTLVYLGALYWRMCGSFEGCVRTYDAWLAARDAETDAAISRGMRALSAEQVDELLAPLPEPLPPITQHDFRVTERGYVTYEPRDDGRLA